MGTNRFNVVKFKILYVFIFLCTSCIDKISADLPAPPKRLVVNAVITPDSIFRVQVSRVTSATDSASRLLSSAQVYLLAPGRGAELLRPQGKGLYYSPTEPASGNVYTLRTEVSGYPSVSATDTMPAVVPIREAWYSYPTATDQNNELLGTVVLRFDDPAPTTNFYEISCYQTAGQGSGVPLEARGNAALVAEDDGGFNPQSLFFSDKLFNGQPFELRASFRPNGHGTTNGVNTVSGELYLVLRSVSRTYYQYRKSWTRHLYNQGTKGDGTDLNQLLFLGDPTALYSNVQGGYGVVAGYAKQTVLLRPR